MLRITPAFRANTAALRATPAPRRCACIAAFRLGGLLFWRADASSGPGGRSTFAAGTTRPKALSKTEAIEKLAEEHGMKKTDVTTVVNGLLDLIQDSVKAGEKVTLTGCAPAPAQRKAAQRSCLHATGLGPDVGVPRRRRPGSAAAARRATRRLLVRALRPAAPARQRRSRRAPGLPPMAWSLEIADSASLRAASAPLSSACAPRARDATPPPARRSASRRPRRVQLRSSVPRAREAVRAARPPALRSRLLSRTARRRPSARASRSRTTSRESPSKGHCTLARCRRGLHRPAPVARAAAGRTRA